MIELKSSRLLEGPMKVKLRITKNGTSLYAGVHDVSGAESFGKACADAWWKIRKEQSRRETSVGALMEHLDDDVLDRLNGAHINLERT